MSQGIWISFIQDYGTYATAASAGLGSLIYIYRKGLKPMIEAIKKYNNMVDKVDKIFFEITPNGGSSIKDKVDNIEVGLNLLSERQRASVSEDMHAKFETDPEGNYIWINRTYARMVQRTPSELMGHGWQNTVTQSERDEVVSHWYDAAKEDREFSMDFTFETPTGELIPCRVKSHKMTDVGGRTIGYYGTIVQH